MKTSPAQQTIVDRCNCMASPAAIQQAEKVPVGGERFLQIAERNPQKKWHKLTRVAFQVSRLMEFCSLRAPQRSDSPHWIPRLASSAICQRTSRVVGVLGKTGLFASWKFRTNAYGWRASSLAIGRLKEAVAEIRSVAKSDAVAAGDGVVSLMERIWPSFQGIDSSSGALGAAVLRTVNEPIPILTVAPADHATRGKWCKTTASNISLAARPSSLYVLLRSHLD